MFHSPPLVKVTRLELTRPNMTKTTKSTTTTTRSPPTITTKTLRTRTTTSSNASTTSSTKSSPPNTKRATKPITMKKIAESPGSSANSELNRINDPLKTDICQYVNEQLNIINCKILKHELDATKERIRNRIAKEAERNQIKIK
nr:PREDICTED: cell wall integrity and stress response component 3-like [Bemisia tabaci]